MNQGIDSAGLARKAASYMQDLTRHPDRHVGGVGNHEATAMFASRAHEYGLDVRVSKFPCIEWEYGEAFLTAGGESFELQVGPYSFACDLTAELVAASSVEEMESESVRGKVLLMHGGLAATQIMPRNFTFYNPDEHRRIYRAIDEYAPAAIVAATGTDLQMVGGLCPFPLFEDGDLHVPNAYMTDREGERLLKVVGSEASLKLDSRRVPTTGDHVVATRKGSADNEGSERRRILVTGHIDSRKDSPGALDNASGVTALLLLAELLGDYSGAPDIEIVPYNGEDNYANPGEMLWIEENRDRMNEIILNVNVDDAGQAGADNHVSFYECPDEIDRAVRDAMEDFPRHSEGPQWPQGDHMILVMSGLPAIAIASTEMEEFMANLAHTEADSVELADPELIAETAVLIREIVERVARV